MGRKKSYRERIRFETSSVEAKSLKNLLFQELRRDFGLSRIESDVLAIRSLIWLQEMNCSHLPGQLNLSIPSTPVKKYAQANRSQVKLTVVDVNIDGEIWRDFGLFVMQRGRALRLLYEAWRQGNWFSYSELSSLLNMTPNALSNRLKEPKEYGLWLPHVGGSSVLEDVIVNGGEGTNYLVSLLLKKYLEGEDSVYLRKLFALTDGTFEYLLRNSVMIWDQSREGKEKSHLCKVSGLRIEEVESILLVAEEYSEKKSWQDLYNCYRPPAKDKERVSGVSGASVRDDVVKKEVDWHSLSGIMCGQPPNKGMLNESLSYADRLSILEKEHGLAPIVCRMYLRRLSELSSHLRGESVLEEGESIFLSLSASEGPRTRLSEGEIKAVRLSYICDNDNDVKRYQNGSGSGGGGGSGSDNGSNKNRVSDLKFCRIQRYTTQAREQGGLLSLPDVAMLMGISIDSVRRHIQRNVQVVVPTRGLIKDIGRGVSHKCAIIELYLQLYTETEIVERTGHCYESVEAYLKEFSRVVVLSDKGLNKVMIRQITGRSMSLVESYLELYSKYDTNPDYTFRLEHIRKTFYRTDPKPVQALKMGSGSKSDNDDSSSNSESIRGKGKGKGKFKVKVKGKGKGKGKGNRSKKKTPSSLTIT